MRFLVAQMGARMHYAVPCILSKRGLLSSLFTDLVSNKPPLSYLNMLSRGVNSNYCAKLSLRTPQGIDKRLIKTFPLFGFRYAINLRKTRSPSEVTAVYLWAGRAFASLVKAHARWSDVDSVYAFNSAALELFVEAKRRGKRTILEQTIAPRFVERELLAVEHSKWPGWSRQDGANIHEQEFCEREQAEWEASAVIVCGSDFVKEGLRQCVTNLAGKCIVVPYGVDGDVERNETSRSAKSRRDRLNILVAGSLGLRKGTPYVMQAARQLSGLADFKLAGTVTAGESALKNLPANVEILGHVNKEEMRRLYSWADVFLLPSICEGSARVTYEALSMGVPVICTPNTGSVVRDGIDGYVVPAGSSEAICEKLICLRSDPGLLSWMSCQAIERSQEFSVDAYGERLIQALL